MLPSHAGQPRRDYVQILIALVWLTVVSIMLLAKMKVRTDVLLLIFLLLATAVQNSDSFLPWVLGLLWNKPDEDPVCKKLKINFLALKQHLKKETLYTFLLAVCAFLAVRVIKVSCGEALGGAGREFADRWVYFGWVYVLMSLGAWLWRGGGRGYGSKYHLNPAVSKAVYDCCSEGGALAGKRNLLTGPQMNL